MTILFCVLYGGRSHKRLYSAFVITNPEVAIRKVMFQFSKLSPMTQINEH